MVPGYRPVSDITTFKYIFLYIQLTPLHLACKNGHLVIVKELLDAGADVGERDGKGNNALDVAIENHHMYVAKLP